MTLQIIIIALIVHLAAVIWRTGKNIQAQIQAQIGRLESYLEYSLKFLDDKEKHLEGKIDSFSHEILEYERKKSDMEKI